MKTLCEHGTLSYLFFDGDLVPVDSCIVPLIIQLNMVGIKTLSSCCGHGKIYPYVMCEQGTEGQLKNFGCKNITTKYDGLVYAGFCTSTHTGKVYTAEWLKKLQARIIKMAKTRGEKVDAPKI